MVPGGGGGDMPNIKDLIPGGDGDMLPGKGGGIPDIKDFIPGGGMPNKQGLLPGGGGGMVPGGGGGISDIKNLIPGGDGGMPNKQGIIPGGGGGMLPGIGGSMKGRPKCGHCTEKLNFCFVCPQLKKALKQQAKDVDKMMSVCLSKKECSQMEELAKKISGTTSSLETTSSE